MGLVGAPDGQRQVVGGERQVREKVRRRVLRVALGKLGVRPASAPCASAVPFLVAARAVLDEDGGVEARADDRQGVPAVLAQLPVVPVEHRGHRVAAVLVEAAGGGEEGAVGGPADAAEEVGVGHGGEGRGEGGGDGPVGGVPEEDGLVEGLGGQVLLEGVPGEALDDGGVGREALQARAGEDVPHDDGGVDGGGGELGVVGGPAHVGDVGGVPREGLVAAPALDGGDLAEEGGGGAVELLPDEDGAVVGAGGEGVAEVAPAHDVDDALVVGERGQQPGLVGQGVFINVIIIIIIVVV